MARKAVYTHSLSVGLSKETRDRIERIADVAEVDMAQVVRDCIDACLDGIELQVGLVDLGDLVQDDEENVPVKENRAAGCFGGPPLPPG